MPLKQTVTLGIGLEVENAFIVIDNFSGHKDDMTFWVNVYLNEQAYQNGNGYLERRQYNFALDVSVNAKEIYTQAYMFLKTLAEYKDANVLN